MAFLSLSFLRFARTCSLYINVYPDGKAIFPVSWKQGYLVERSGSLRSIRGSYSAIWSLPLLTSYSDFPTDQAFHQFHDLNTELDLHRITSVFYGAFATGVACHQGTLTLPDNWFRPHFWDLFILQLLRPDFSNLPCLYSIFHLQYTSVLSRFCLKAQR